MAESLRGKLILASPVLRDPNFARTVVLIAEHTEDGAMGLVLNRPATSTVGEAVPDLTWLAGEAEPVYGRGPGGGGGSRPWGGWRGGPSRSTWAARWPRRRSSCWPSSTSPSWRARSWTATSASSAPTPTTRSAPTAPSAARACSPATPAG